MKHALLPFMDNAIYETMNCKVEQIKQNQKKSKLYNSTRNAKYNSVVDKNSVPEQQSEMKVRLRNLGMAPKHHKFSI